MERQKENICPKKNPEEGLPDGAGTRNPGGRNAGKGNFRLSARLSAVAEMVTQGNRLVDVGCDHGYLPVYLVLCGRIPSAIAMDVRPGPLSRAREHIRNYQLSDYIEWRLSDGLAALSPGEGDTLALAGMGGPLMERILTDGAAVRESFSELVLQPQSDVPHFRHFIRAQGWEIVSEEMVLEDGKFYPVMRAVRSRASLPDWSPLEETFGKILLMRRHPVLREYLLREKRICEEILWQLEKSAGKAAQIRTAEVQEKLRMILEALSRYTPKQR